ncbi:MAG: DnaJ domain-containing protein [Vicinamibacterales bacterium]
MRDYFQILGVPHNAGAAAIRDACRQLSPRYHPDISGDCAATAHGGDAPAARHDGAIARHVGRGETAGDEIAIDFPSVTPIVDRMREAFFAGGPAARWSAHLELTVDEARIGASVPIDVPHRETCGACDGRGETWDAGCGECGGRGTTPGAHRVRLIVPPGAADGAHLIYQVRLPAGAPAILAVSISVAEGRA